MADTKELLGALLRRGLTDSSASRIEHSLGENGIGGPGGILEEEFGVKPAEATVASKGAQASATSWLMVRAASTKNRIVISK